MKLILERFPDIDVSEAVLVAAARNSNREAMQLLLERVVDADISEAVLVAAFLSRNRAVVQVLLERIPNTSITEAVLIAIARGGSDECMKDILATNRNLEITEMVLLEFACNLSVSGLEVFRRSGCDSITEAILMASIQSNHITPVQTKRMAVRFLLNSDSNTQITETLLIAAFWGEDMAMIQHLLSRAGHIEMTEAILLAAVHGAGIELLLGWPSHLEITEAVLEAAAWRLTKAPMAILLARSANGLVTEAVIERAAANHAGPEVLELLLGMETRIMVTESILVTAVRSQKQKTVEFLIQSQNVPITEAVLIAAASSGNIDTTNFLLTRSEHIEITEALLVAAASVKDVDMIKLLLAQSTNIQITEPVLVAAASSSSKTVVKFLLGQPGSPGITDAIILAAANRSNSSLLRLLLALSDKIKTTDEMVVAAVFAGLQVVQLLIANDIDTTIPELAVIAAADRGAYDRRILDFFITREERIKVTEITEPFVTATQHLIDYEGWERLLSGRHINRKVTTGAFKSAMFFGNSQLVNQFFEHGYEVPQESAVRQSCLRAAIEGGLTPMIRKLVYPGGSIADIDKHGWTPFMVAIQSGRGNVIEMLKTSGCDALSTAIPPERWEHNFSPSLATLSNDGKEFTCLGTPAQGYSAAAKRTLITANHPLPPRINGTAYFEVNIKTEKKWQLMYVPAYHSS